MGSSKSLFYMFKSIIKRRKKQKQNMYITFYTNNYLLRNDFEFFSKSEFEKKT